MKNKILFASVLFFLISGPLPLLSQQSFSLKKDIVVDEGEVQNNIVTFGGVVHVKGRVKEGVIAFGGEVIISGEVDDVVLGFGSTITLEPTARVRGDVASIGGTLIKKPGCTVEGDTIYFKTSEDISKLFEEGVRGFLSVSLIPLLLIIKLISVLIWFLLALLIAAFFPRQISYASAQIRKSFWPIFATGLLSIIIFSGLVIFSALLSLVLIGIPILLALIIVGFIAKIFGRVILFYFFGESIISAFGKGKISPLLAVVLGLILVSVVSFIPVIGVLFTFIMSIIGWGVVIRTKFGTTENWFKRA
jgi:hypothetical protein